MSNGLSATRLERVQFWSSCVLKGFWVAGWLLLFGVITQPLQDPAWDEVRAKMPPSMQLKELEPALGQGVMIGLFGGFRSIIANIFYIRGYHYWEQKDVLQTQTALSLANEVNPASMYFWLNRVRMVAYDFPVWRIQEQGGFDLVPESVQRRFFAEEAERALRILDRAEIYHLQRHEIPLERAQIYLNRLEDKENAGKFFLIASKMKNAPAYAERLHAQMLYDLGHQQAAYDFLRSVFNPPAPGAEPTPREILLLQRIRSLEDELAIPGVMRLPPQDF